MFDYDTKMRLTSHLNSDLFKHLTMTIKMSKTLSFNIIQGSAESSTIIFVFGGEDEITAGFLE